MNAYESAILSKKRFGTYLLAFSELIGKDEITNGMVDGMMNTMDIVGYKNFVSFNDEFMKHIPGDDRFHIIVDIPKEEDTSLSLEYFSINKFFPVSMNTQKTVGILLGEQLCCAVTGYDIKHELYVIKFDNIDDVPSNFVAYPSGGHLTYVATAKDLADLNFNVSIVVMCKA